MNEFLEIKRMLQNKQVVEHYLGKPVKTTTTGNWYISPFRKEKTASFCVSDKGIHDFGDSMHYDIISFVAKFYNVKQITALQELKKDFGLDLSNQYQTSATIQLMKKKRQEEQEIKLKIKEWFNTEFAKLCEEENINNKCIKILNKNGNFEGLSYLYDKQVKLACLIEMFINAKEEDKERIFLESLEVRK